MTSSEFQNVMGFLNGNIYSKLKNIPEEIKNDIQEIRLRVNRQLCLSVGRSIYYVTQNGCVTNTILKDNMFIVSARDIMETFNNICNFSVYSKQNEIKNGYITLKGGHRAGICGTAVFDNNKISNIKDISSINIRVAKEFKNCSNILFEKIKSFTGGVLICGSPCSGKTTLIRDFARKLSYTQKVSVIDSRCEIAATYKGIPQKDIGICDVLNGYSKADGFNHAIRCMSPDYIICDEIGSAEDVLSIENAVNCGAYVIATAHCANKTELLNKNNLKKLLEINAFKYVVFLDNHSKPLQSLQVNKVADFIS